MKERILFLILLITLNSCARVGVPHGGEKDSLAPVFLKSNIDTSRVNISTNLKELRLDFDEYINLKDINKNLIISPPIKKIKKIIPSNLANKYILIQWDEALQENTTYNFNFGNAIVDNNEGNILPYFNFAFSTGNQIDNLYISGTTKEAGIPPQNTPKNIVVGLYKENSDFRQKPYYITKADEDGYFELNYLAKGQYHIIAFEDENQNSVYDIGKEKLGFLKGKLNLTQNISGLNIELYPSKKEKKYLGNKNMDGGLLLLFEGNPDNIEIRSVDNEFSDYIATHQTKSDSAKIWINKNSKYLKKDTPTQLKFAYKADEKEDTISVFFKSNEKEEISITNKKEHLLPPNKEFIITSNMEIKNIDTKQWNLKSDSLNEPFKAEISKNNAKEIKIFANFKVGEKYALSIPKGSLMSHYEQNLKSYIFNFEIDRPENYGGLILKLKNPPSSNFWIQLIDNEGNVKYNQYTHLPEVRFTEIKPDDYYVRIIVDENNNNYWDKGDFSEQYYAEKVFLFEKKITIRKLWEIVEDWEINTLK